MFLYCLVVGFNATDGRFEINEATSEKGQADKKGKEGDNDKPSHGQSNSN